MQYDPSTANVDRWHGFSQDDFSKGFKSVDQGAVDDTNNMRQLYGGTMPADCDDSMSERSD